MSDPPTLTLEQYQQIAPIADLRYGSSTMRYHVPNDVALWRVQTFETKEPETVKWLASFTADDIFVDIGANVGMYTIFAAVHAGARVFAFEPESQNYALLNRNIHANSLSQRVTAFCCALSDTTGLDRLYLSTFAIGQSGHEFGAEVDAALNPRSSPFAQGSLSVTLDSLVEAGSVPCPTQVKIDVDGFEHKVVSGAMSTFANPTVRSVLIEISPHIDDHQALIGVMADLGFSYDAEQVERARRKQGATLGFAEYIFRR